MRVRPVRPEDQPHWYRLRCALWPGSNAEHARETQRYFVEAMPGLAMALVAETDDGELVGFAELSIRAYAEGCETERVGFLEGWYTARDLRGTGVGRTLVEAALGWARGEGCVEFASDSVPENEVSRRAHVACGFEEVGLIRCYRMRLDGKPKRWRRRHVVGVDLSGPANTDDTAVAVFRATATTLRLLDLRAGCGDAELCDLVARLSERAPVIGLDAPLSYNPGGGDRPADRGLRQRAQQAGLESGSVMTPTMSRMAYLTLRGMAVARALQIAVPTTRLVEVHPGAAMALRGAPIGAVRSFKSRRPARRRLLAWLAGQGLRSLPDRSGTDHEVAALACGFAAWRWSTGESVWQVGNNGPLHPFDFAC